MSLIVLKLYVVKRLPSSEQIIRQVREMLKDGIKNHYVLRVIDVETEPQQAEKDNILAAPSLVRVEPKPEKKIIGDLSNRTLLFSTLGLKDSGAEK